MLCYVRDGICKAVDVCQYLLTACLLLSMHPAGLAKGENEEVSGEIAELKSTS